MPSLYDRATRWALNLVNPYVHGSENAVPQTRFWPFLHGHLYPLRWVILLSLIMTILAASVEVRLISYAGKLIDMPVDSAPSGSWRENAGSITFATFMLIILRPFIQFLRYAVNDIGGLYATFGARQSGGIIGTDQPSEVEGNAS